MVHELLLGEQRGHAFADLANRLFKRWSGLPGVVDAQAIALFASGGKDAAGGDLDFMWKQCAVQVGQVDVKRHNSCLAMSLCAAPSQYR